MTTLFVLLKHWKATSLDHNLIEQDPVQTGQKNYPYTRRNVTSIKQQSCRLMWEYKEKDNLCLINNILIILGTLGSWLMSKVFRYPSKSTVLKALGTVNETVLMMYVGMTLMSKSVKESSLLCFGFPHTCESYPISIFLQRLGSHNPKYYKI